MIEKHNGRGYVRQKYCELRKRNQSYCHLLSVGQGRHSFNSRASHFYNLFSFPRCSPCSNSLYTRLLLPLSFALDSGNFKDNNIACKLQARLFVLTPKPLATTLEPPTCKCCKINEQRETCSRAAVYSCNSHTPMCLCNFWAEKLCQMVPHQIQISHKADDRVHLL